MKTWLVPVCLIAVMLIGAFLIPLAEHKPIAWMNPPAPEPVYYPPTPPAQFVHDTSTEPNFISFPINTNAAQKNAIFIQGNSNSITWQGEDSWVVDIILIDASGTRLGYIASHDFFNLTHGAGIVNANTAIWSAQNVSPSPKFEATVPRVTVAPGSYKVLIINPVTNVSSSFDLSIVAVGPLRVLTPRTGEILRQGQLYTIQWIKGNDTTTYVGLNLLQNGILLTSIGNVLNNGSYVWAVPKNYSGINFTIALYGNTGTGSGPFSIVP